VVREKLRGEIYRVLTQERSSKSAIAREFGLDVKTAGRSSHQAN
jgi:hypothetical protein